MGHYNDNREIVSDAAAATVKAFTVTYTSNEPTASTVATVADGDAVASNESGVLFVSMQRQIDALIVDVASIRTKLQA